MREVSSLPRPPPLPCSSLSQMYFIINQLVAHLPACCFFLSIKHLLLLVENMTLHIVCRLSGGADLEGPVWTISLGLTPRAVIKHKPSAKCHTAAKHKEDTGGRRQTPRAPVTHTDTGQWLKKNNVYFKCRRKRKDVELEGNQAGKLKSKDKYALRLHHKQGNYGVFQNRGQAV